MRTTLTLDPDVARAVKRRMEEGNLSLKETVNQALRTGLSAPERNKQPRFKLRPHSLGPARGIDLNKMNQLADQLETEEVLRKLRK